METIENLEQEITKYRQGFYYGTSQEDNNETKNQQGEGIQIEVDHCDQQSEGENRTEFFRNNSSNSLLLNDRDGENIELERLETQGQETQTLHVPPCGVPGSSKK